MVVSDEACYDEEDARRLFPFIHVNHFGSVDIDWDAGSALVGIRRAETALGAATRDDLPTNSSDRPAAMLQSVSVPLW